MSADPVYLDHAAGSPLRPAAWTAIEAWYSGPAQGNPHATHAGGRRAERAVRQARSRIAQGLGVPAGDVIFTSGATEANGLALIGHVAAVRRLDPRRRTILHGATDHASVLSAVDWLCEQGFERLEIPVDAEGAWDFEALRQGLGRDPVLVTAAWVNNETGVIQDVGRIASAAIAAGARFHCDAVQALGRLPLDPSGLGFSSAAFSAHKIGGPAGIGALYLPARLQGTLASPLAGGGQQGRVRGGTLAGALMAGFAAAAEEALADPVAEERRLTGLADRLSVGLGLPTPNGSHRVAGIHNVTLPGLDADLLVRTCRTACLATGAACAADRSVPSHVLTAMGRDPLAASSSLRFSLGWSTETADIDRVITELPAELEEAGASPLEFAARHTRSCRG